MKPAVVVLMCACLTAAGGLPTSEELRAQVLDRTLSIATRYQTSFVTLVKQTPTLAVETLRDFFADPQVAVADKIYFLKESTRSAPSIGVDFYSIHYGLFFEGYLGVLKASLVEGRPPGSDLVELAKGPFAAYHAMRLKMSPEEYLRRLQPIFVRANDVSVESLLTQIGEFGDLAVDENFLSEAVLADASGTRVAIQWTLEVLLKYYSAGRQKVASAHLALLSGWMEALPSNVNEPFLIQLVELAQTLDSQNLEPNLEIEESTYPSAEQLVRLILRRFRPTEGHGECAGVLLGK